MFDLGKPFSNSLETEFDDDELPFSVVVDEFDGLETVDHSNSSSFAVPNLCKPNHWANRMARDTKDVIPTRFPRLKNASESKSNVDTTLRFGRLRKSVMQRQLSLSFCQVSETLRRTRKRDSEKGCFQQTEKWVDLDDRNERWKKRSVSTEE